LDKWGYTAVPVHERGFFVSAATAGKSMVQLMATLNDWGSKAGG
jgi:hypothetical protein